MMKTIAVQLSAAFIILAAAGIALRFKLTLPQKSQLTRSRHEPEWLSHAIKVNAALLGAVTLVATIFPGKLPITSLLSEVVICCMGAVFGVIGCSLMYISLSALGSNFSGTSGTYSDHELVVSGPYRFVRHPYYLATALIVFGLSLLLGSISIAFFGTFLLVTLAMRSRAEDRELREKFGEVYEKWERSTGSYLPRFRSPPIEND
ncbi:MAG: isoprenylcysteine carboxylmethyltransferase family protein [Planctomycetaceae bacterium]|nr:isoprenylcysteine carboxylmethyltransferase family protein [Planctomycetaceae bacterium]MBN8604667.1 isoprenylcysteine carboxylmethyltransferase family protein [Planctomycetota bacterium]